LRTDDILGAKSVHAGQFNHKLSRFSPKNPNEPFEHQPLGKVGGLAHIGPEQGCRNYIRSNLEAKDVNGPTRGELMQKFNTRDNLRTDDIKGAQTKIYHQYYYDKQSYMGAQDIPPKK
jgi:hypothetical protein